MRHTITVLGLALAGLALPQTIRADEPTPAAAAASRLWAVMDLIQDQHIDPPARQEMCLGAVKGLFAAKAVESPRDLSRKASAVASAEQFAALVKEFWPTAGVAPADAERAMLRGMLQVTPGAPMLIRPAEMPAPVVPDGELYVGTGIQIAFDQTEKLTRIVLPFRRGPARVAGAKPNDLIVAVDGVPMAGKDLPAVVKALRGKKGTNVSMTVRQPSSKEERTLKMVRDIVPFETLYGFQRVSEEEWGYRVSPGSSVGYVWVNDFGSSTVHDLRQLERRLQAQGVKALVLDLRNTSPGDLRHTTQAAAALVEGGVLWRVRGANGETREINGGTDTLFRGWPIAILISEKTATAPALLAAALHDNGRAVVVGEPVGGSGYVNAIVPLPDSRDTLRLPVARFERAVKPDAAPPAEDADETPGGFGLRPDHRVGLPYSQHSALAKWQSDKVLPELPAGTDDRPPVDPQLAKAVELLSATLAKSPAAAGPKP